MQKTAEKISEEMPAKREEYQGYLTIQGRENILDQMTNIITGLTNGSICPCTGQSLEELEEPLSEAIRNKLKL